MSGKKTEPASEEGGFDFGEEFDDIEIRPMTEEEYAAANLAHEAFLERERAEREELARGFEEELDALIETIKPGEPPNAAEAAQADPPGWPDL